MTPDEYTREATKEAFVVTTWTVDFWRAFHERPRLLRWVARMAMGRYAWRELAGARDALEWAGYDPRLPYDLRGMEYHQERV